MRKMRRKLGLAVGVLYHGVAHPLAALTLMSGNKDAQKAAEWVLQGLQRTALDLLHNNETNAENDASSDSSGISESLKPFRNEDGEVVVRGFLAHVEQHTTQNKETAP